MFIFKGFALIQSLASNVPGQVAAIGELSSMCSTYAKEKGIYWTSAANNVGVVSFTCKLNTTNVELGIVQRDVMLSVMEYLINSIAIPDATQSTKNIILADLNSVFNPNLSSFTIGNIVSSNGVRLPEWISWSSGTVGQQNSFKIWTADASFASQYDDYEIIVVPPVANLDTLFAGPAQVGLAMSNIDVPTLMDNTQLAKNGYPETVTRTKSFDYTGGATPIKTLWNVVIYGKAGDNLVAIQEAVANYILANATNKTRNDWSGILPDIFKHSEFTIIPEWYKYATRRVQY